MLKLRPYQQDIVNQTINSNDDTLIEVPTGGGKTLIAREISLELIVKDMQVLFVTPRETLLRQTEEDFKGLNTQTVHGLQKYEHDHPMLISTLQTANRRKDLNPDVIIIDEVHYGYSGKMIRELKEKNPQSRIIGLSATPYDKDGKLIKGFGLIIDQYDMDYMIRHKYLVPILSKVLVEPNLKGIRLANNGDYHLQELGDRVGKEKAVMEVVSATKEHIKNTNKCIVFAVDINHAKLLALAYDREGIKSEVLHSEIDKDTQKRIIRRFKQNDFKNLVSVQMITMGFNVPEVDMAVIARPTKSQNLYKQMVGRITRLAHDKKFGTLLDCGSVIKNLGLPSKPIEERIYTEFNGKNVCPDCGSEKLVYRKINGKPYWVCKECAYKKDIVKTAGYKCKACNKVYAGESLAFNDKQILLNCTCGHITIVSESTGKEELVDITDYNMIELLKQRLVKEYEEIIIRIFGIKELRKENIQNHIKAFELYIQNIPSDMIYLDLNDIINKNNRWIFSKVTQDELLMEVNLDIENKKTTKTTIPIKEAIYFEEFIQLLKKRLNRNSKRIRNIYGSFEKYQYTDDFKISFDDKIHLLVSQYNIRNKPVKNDNGDFIVKQHYKDGKLKYKQTFSNGKMDGVKNLFRLNGLPSKDIIYKDGEAYHMINYTKKGIIDEHKDSTEELEYFQREALLYAKIYELYFKFINQNKREIT